MKKIAIFGSTGSVGKNTVKVLKGLGNFKVNCLYCGHNLEHLKEQAESLNPDYVGSFFKENRNQMRTLFENDYKILTGVDEAVSFVKKGHADIIVIASSGISSYKLLTEGLKKGLRVATANKETLVAYYPLLKGKINKMPGELIPVDSEHSAIFQSLVSSKKENIKRILLTASGGPFYSRENLETITPAEALNHPTWDMGIKVTVDSATMMNKGLEIIEASVLFDLPPEKIEVLIHPQSIIHGMVEFADNSIIAQLSSPDMKIPIQYALTYPEREETPVKQLSCDDFKSITFDEINHQRFPSIELSYKVLKKGGTLPAVMVGADEIAVEKFLNKEIGFNSIIKIVKEVVRSHDLKKNPDEKDIKNALDWAKEKAMEIKE